MSFWPNYKTLCLILCLFVMPLAACNAAEEKMPVSPLIIHADKTNLMFQVEIAKTPEQLEHGLMYRKELAAHKGMLFIFPEVRSATFWMENTLIPLDMIFIKEDGTIAHIHPMAQPLDRTPIPSEYPVKAVLEIPGGESAKQGIKVGQSIDPALLKME